MAYRDANTYRGGGSSSLLWLLAAAVAVALTAGGVLLWALWPKGRSSESAHGREVAPRTGYDADEREAVDLFKSSKDAVVNVDTVVFRRGLDSQMEALQAGTGSGFIWDDDGHIVTNFHVVKEAILRKLALRVVLADRSEWKVDVVGVAPDYDLAVVRISKSAPLKKIKVGASKDLEVGQKVYAIGNPFGLSLTLTKGIISALDREIESPSGQPISGVIQTDAPINPGNSGGPLLDKDGRLIGVNTAIATAKGGSGGSIGIGFAVPVDTVNWVVPQLISSGKLLKPDLGVTLVDQVRLRRAGYRAGVMIAQVEPSGPAAAAGLRSLTADPRTREVIPGDIILRVNGEEVKGNAEFERLMNRFKPGDTVKLTIQRGDEKIEVPVTLRGV